MTITITSTNEIVSVNGIEARVWHGVTDAGIACKVLVPVIMVEEGEDQAAFAAELAGRAVNLVPLPDAPDLAGARVLGGDGS